MPATLTYPGVYIQELPSGSRTITGVATAVAAFVGRAPARAGRRAGAISSLRAVRARLRRALARRAGWATPCATTTSTAATGRGRPAAPAAPPRPQIDGRRTTSTLTAPRAGRVGRRARGRGPHASDPEATLVAAQQGVRHGQLFHLTVREGPLAEPARRRELHQRHALRRTASRRPRARGLRAGPRDGARRSTASDRPTQKHRRRDGTGDRVRVATARDGRQSARRHATTRGGRFDDGQARPLRAAATRTCSRSSCLPPGDPARTSPDGAVGRRARALRGTSGRFCSSTRPPTATATSIEDWVAAIAGLAAIGRNAAVYFPRIRRAGPAARRRDRRRSCPSGAVAGIMARTDGDARRVEGAGRASRPAIVGRERADRPAHRRRERRPQPARHQLPAHVPGHRHGRLGRAHAARRRRARRRVQVRPGAAARAVPRGDAVPQHAVGRLRAQRRAAVGADPHVDRRVHAGPVPPGRVPGQDAARRLLRALRRGDDDPVRHRPRHREHRRRLRAAQAGRVRRRRASSRRPRARRPEEDAHGRVHRQRHALRPVQELQVPREVGRPLRRRRQQGRRAEAHDRGGHAPQRRRPELAAASRPAARSTRRSRSSAASPTTSSSSSGPTRSGTSAPGSARRRR